MAQDERDLSTVRRTSHAAVSAAPTRVQTGPSGLDRSLGDGYNLFQNRTLALRL